MTDTSAALSVVIPAVNAAAALAATIRSLPADLVAEVIVSDGGSTDDTIRVATATGASIVAGPAGRGGQLARGAATARGDWLLFLHADTVLGMGAGAAMAAFMADPENLNRAGVFRFRLDDPRRRARALERVVALRCRLLALPYGDQGLLMSRQFYDWIGGFGPMPLMEDVDMIRRIGRSRTCMLDASAITSAARYIRDGYVRRMARNAFCLTLYGLGVSPQRISRVYDR
ncbi:MAG: TIGR04283 family arsenosugar biosynthesis glycosyltransferase [Sphingomonadales bacterium]